MLEFSRIGSLFTRHPDALRMKALRRQIIENGEAPSILVKNSPALSGIPVGLFAEDETVVLSVGSESVADLLFTSHGLVFDALFDDVRRQVKVPLESVLAMYSAETGSGLLFGELRAASPGYDEEEVAENVPRRG